MQPFKTMLIAVLSFAVLGVGQFIFCTAIAMARFPEGYSFSRNFLSDLGRTTVDASSLFNGSLVLLYVIAFICQSGVAVVKNWDPEDTARQEKEAEYLSTLVNQGSRKMK